MNHRKLLLPIVIASLTPVTTLAQNALEEVIVTAQKREQGLQDVPISVVAFGEDRMDNLGIDDIRELVQFTPNVSASGSANQVKIKIRGIVSNDFGVGSDPAVGVYIDGVYIGRGGGAELALNDIQRIEVLNGPQGTLFGRNAAAGALQYISNKPNEESEGWVKATAGIRQRLQVEGMYNTALSENLYWRSTFLHNQRDGFTKNLTTGNFVEEQENWSIATALRWQPNENLDAIWRFDYHEVDNIGRPSSSVAYGPRNAGPAFNTVENDDELPSSREIIGTSLHLDYDLGWATLTSISSYREYETLNPEEQDGSANIDYRFNDYNAEDNRQWSQELRLSGEAGDSLRWTVGGIYSEENAGQRSGITLSPEALDRRIVEGEVGIPYANVAPGTGFNLAFAFGFPGVSRIYANGNEALAADEYTEFINVESITESWGVFADATWSITDTVDLTVGVRYNEDKKNFGRNVAFNDFGIQFAFAETRVNANGELDENGEQGWYFQNNSWDKTTGRVVLDWQALENTLVYASWATGYKSGGFNSVSDRNNDSPFDMETVENIELGFKSTWFDNTLRVNGAVFSYDYGDLQEQEFIDGACINQEFGTYQFLSSDVDGKGFELSVNWLAAPGLELWANLGRVKADVEDRQRCVVVNGVPTDVNLAGAVHANEFSYSLGANYTVDFDNKARVVASVSWAKASDQKDRQNCWHVETTADGRVASTKFQNVNGDLIVTDDSAVAPYLDANGNQLRDLPFGSCPDKDGREELTARVTYYSPTGNWEVGTWVTNASNWEDNGDPGGQASNLRSNFDDSSLSYSGAVEPTAYGLDLRYNF